VILLLGASGGWLGLGSATGLIFLMLICVGLNYPNSTALSLAPFAKKAGTASALMGTIQWGVGSLSSYGMGFAHGQPLLTLAEIVALASALGLLVVLAGRRGIARPVEPEAAAVVAMGH